MSFPPRPPMVPYGIAPGVVTMPMATHVMVGAYSGTVTTGGGSGRGALLPAPKSGRTVPRHTNGKDHDGPAVTVFIGNISSRAPEAMIRALLSACGPVLSWKRVSTFGFCEFAGPEAALRCVRLLHDFPLADKKLLARTDGKMQGLVDTYKTEQRSRMAGEEAGGAGGAGGAEGAAGEADSYLDAAQRALDEAAQRRLADIVRDHQHEINNYELLQQEEAISKTARVLEEADISEEKRDVIHREIGKFRESMKVTASLSACTFLYVWGGGGGRGWGRGRGWGGGSGVAGQPATGECRGGRRVAAHDSPSTSQYIWTPTCSMCTHLNVTCHICNICNVSSFKRTKVMSEET
ncbi:RNA-binding protein 25 [Papilio xuthus]|uniref:RNA-binding protein 25 n=1 Tax=Papilio xuthus TaxID=66420 RepID=A0A0N1I5G3_PAPXU|nr:RNA-binding protein 25 [Papilio xuthus]